MEHLDWTMVSLDGVRRAVPMAVSPPEGLGVEERGGVEDFRDFGGRGGV